MLHLTFATSIASLKGYRSPNLVIEHKLSSGSANHLKITRFSTTQLSGFLCFFYVLERVRTECSEGKENTLLLCQSSLKEIVADIMNRFY